MLRRAGAAAATAAVVVVVVTFSNLNPHSSSSACCCCVIIVVVGAVFALVVAAYTVDEKKETPSSLIADTITMEYRSGGLEFQPTPSMLLDNNPASYSSHLMQRSIDTLRSLGERNVDLRLNLHHHHHHHQNAANSNLELNLSLQERNLNLERLMDRERMNLEHLERLNLDRNLNNLSGVVDRGGGGGGVVDMGVDMKYRDYKSHLDGLREQQQQQQQQHHHQPQQQQQQHQQQQGRNDEENIRGNTPSTPPTPLSVGENFQEEKVRKELTTSRPCFLSCSIVALVRFLVVRLIGGFTGGLQNVTLMLVYF